MKLAIATRADSNIKEMTDITHPAIKHYAKEWGCDFIVLDKDSEVHRCHYRILEFKELLKTYDRILSIDSDIVMNKNVPNPFDIVPYEKIGTIYEDVGSRERARRNTIQEVQKAYGDIGWKTGYINTGFFMVSKPHACIFEKINGNLWGGTGVDDIQLGYNIVKNKIPVYDFHWKWNTMTMFCEKWNGSPDRFNSYITHFAGVGKFENRFNNRLENIKHDYNKIWGKNE